MRPISLVYCGRIPSGSGGGQNKKKHTIRAQFHWQLRAFVERHPYEAAFDPHPGVLPLGVREFQPDKEMHANWPVPHGGYQVESDRTVYMPLLVGFVTLRVELYSAAKVREDVDNQAKTLLDALCIPSENQHQEDPDLSGRQFYCLLSDDAQVTDLHVGARELLIPDGKPFATVRVLPAQ